MEAPLPGEGRVDIEQIHKIVGIAIRLANTQEPARRQQEAAQDASETAPNAQPALRRFRDLEDEAEAIQKRPGSVLVINVRLLVADECAEQRYFRARQTSL